VKMAAKTEVGSRWLVTVPSFADLQCVSGIVVENVTRLVCCKR